ncbi:ATP/GTP-binding protein [Streptomyces sp. NPDC102441]|uniref:AAA family ATPase n=1 Tax=Streptomyces sp. NPDC102441 TaxID=3366176 RepID=UPI0037F84C31
MTVSTPASTTDFDLPRPGTHLVAFRITNVGSARHTEELDLTVGKTEETGTFPMNAPHGPLAVTAVAALFGANASGTSTVLGALANMREAVLTSYTRQTAPVSPAHRPFALSPDNAAEPSTYEIELVRDGEQWTYGFAVSARGVEREWLHSVTAADGLRTWIDRDAARTDRSGCAYRWHGLTPDTGRLEHLGSDRTLTLSLGGLLQVGPFRTVYDFFRTELLLIAPRDAQQQGRARARLAESAELRGRIGPLLTAADLGVNAVEIDPADGEMKLAHTAAGGRSVLLDWAMESSGTRALVLVLERVLWALEHGSVILIDGLGSPLHPLLTAEITTLFVASWSNLRHAQLLCTSHAVALLGGARHGQSLEPHQVWLAERGRDGSTEVYPLTDAKPGSNEDLADSYLAGAFGGVPGISEGRVGRALLAAGSATRG